MNSENKDTSSIIIVRILHVVACIIVFFWGGCFLSFASHHNSGDGALGALGLLLILAVQFVVVLFGLITINVVVHKRSGKLVIPSVLLLFCTSLFWFLDEKELGISFVCLVPFCGVISYLCDRWIERLKKKLDIK
ncbi:MAG: hypothetical protein UH850_10335 [Paludibacteraceae bacterium]|nr:hypothetical protein [Paludibacteraceae bacterium]